MSAFVLAFALNLILALEIGTQSQKLLKSRLVAN